MSNEEIKVTVTMDGTTDESTDFVAVLTKLECSSIFMEEMEHNLDNIRHLLM